MPIVVDRQASPRGLIHGFDEEVAAKLAELVPSAVILAGAQRTSAVRQEEFDVVFAGAGLDAFAFHLYAVGFGAAGSCGRAVSPQMPQYVNNNVGFAGFTVAREFLIPDDLPEEVRPLVTTDLLPLVRSRPRNHYLAERTNNHVVVDAPQYVSPFLSTTEPRHLAGRFARPGNKSEVWALPEGADVVAWARAALLYWRTVDPERFPQGPDWRGATEWATPAERAIVAAIEAGQHALQEGIARQEADLASLRLRLVAARDAADLAERRLLTAQDEELVEAVGNSLHALGFTVTKMDEILPAGDKREDLRIMQPDVQNWECIAEVRGYGRGAQLNDLLRIQGRFAPRYAAEKGGQLPSRRWYIVNAFLNRDPAMRDLPLQSNPAEVAQFADDDGLILDTRDLLRLHLAVMAGVVTPEDARRQLSTATGRFTYPP